MPSLFDAWTVKQMFLTYFSVFSRRSPRRIVEKRERIHLKYSIFEPRFEPVAVRIHVRSVIT